MAVRWLQNCCVSAVEIRHIMSLKAAHLGLHPV